MAGTKYIRIAKKLQSACKKQFGIKLLIDQRQWYHKDKDMFITVYTLYQCITNEDRNGTQKIKLFQTYSQIQLVLFMRDMWYELNNWEVPTDNKIWQEIKQNYVEKEEPSETSPGAVRGNIESERGTELNRTAVCDELYQGWKCNRSGTDDSRDSTT